MFCLSSFKSLRVGSHAWFCLFCMVQGIGGWCGGMSVCVVSLDPLIPAHLRCTQCSILLHLIGI